MKCPYCFKDNNYVLHTRVRKQYVQRRRICMICGNKFSTRERIALDSVKNCLGNKEKENEHEQS